MTFQILGTIRRYSGLSTDTKPVTTGTGRLAVPDGATFYETDTRRTYTYDGNQWWLQSDPVATERQEALLAEQLLVLKQVRLGFELLIGQNLAETSA